MRGGVRREKFALERN